LLQQDLRHTTNDMNNYMRNEITRTLQEEFKKYEDSIGEAKKIALESIDKTVAVIEQQRHLLEEQLKAQSDAQKERVLKRFETEMASIVNHYVLKAIGNQIDLTDQLDFIMNELETNKQAIIEDIKNGAA
jgi:F0F1-type ATP synthase membrane subunit b/b'